MIAKTAARALGIAAIAGSAITLFAGPASAQIITESHDVGVAHCPNAQQACGDFATVTIDAERYILVTFTASPQHCSEVFAHILVDGVKWDSTEKVGPGETTVGQFIPVTSGHHFVSLEMEGVTGGCNTGYLSSWGGTLTLETERG